MKTLNAIACIVIGLTLTSCESRPKMVRGIYTVTCYQWPWDAYTVAPLMPWNWRIDAPKSKAKASH
jgi:hypothetical protein